MAAVFISRDLEPGSLFRQRLESAGHTVTGRSLVAFSAVPFVLEEPFDWVFFSSPRAVDFFLEGVPPLVAGTRLAVLGPGTGRALQAHGYEADFTGDGDPSATAAAFLALAAGQRVLFPQARNSRRSVQQWLGTEVQSQEVVVYDNVPVAQVPAGPFQVLVFTSPLNARAFCAARKLQAAQLVVAIGNTTARALQKLGREQVRVADKPDETELAAAVLELLKSNGK